MAMDRIGYRLHTDRDKEAIDIMKTSSVLLLIALIFTSCAMRIFYTEHEVETTSDRYIGKPVENLLIDSPDIQIDQIGANKFRYLEYYPVGILRYMRVQYIAIDGIIRNVTWEEVVSERSELVNKGQNIRRRMDDFE